ncbi:hypothetical protein M231_05803 [Tremella mesenterica]|uniref:Uncharacterized protein n=1 Tax=Tremella mesenterica TaxID=5217 RepID=A0A4Q1BH37_TREME|nr:hypothetical protein M231_05803 [Tremella mesenterica]
MAGGWGIMRYSTPTEEQFYQSLSPELKKKVDQVRIQRAGGDTALKSALEDASKSDQIVWAEQLGNSKSPGGGRRV